MMFVLYCIPFNNVYVDLRLVSILANSFYVAFVWTYAILCIQLCIPCSLITTRFNGFAVFHAYAVTIVKKDELAGRNGVHWQIHQLNSRCVFRLSMPLVNQNGAYAIRKHVVAVEQRNNAKGAVDAASCGVLEDVCVPEKTYGNMLSVTEFCFVHILFINSNYLFIFGNAKRSFPML